MTLTVGSLFSGIGGLDLGFERAGFKVRWQIEIDEWARKVLKKHWPNVPQYADVKEVGKHNLEAVDILIGGFPCQDISSAGKGLGLNGERSGLWAEYARLIDELRPRYAVMENVSALFYRGHGRILGDLAAIGYDTEWDCLPAAAFGAPHLRERVFIVAYPYQDRRRPGSKVLPTCKGSVGSSLQFDSKACWNGIQIDRQDPSTYWQVQSQPLIYRMDDGFSDSMDRRIRQLGNAVVPQVAQYVAECVKAHAEQAVAV
jgi:DNA (cytosine-5)-methyltransferase 1